ncbi:MAG: bifunctional phosphoribosylaminoimidazolecarboxamide formyltransferase/IMP cyclohydrolase [Oscillospiraceae bacterium]|nr:bifunctional phosphoribosylaminoimidazolecarboxamide formyltransferase/IMP cyclohydrolase [Oscillospiraceae bacterium]
MNKKRALISVSDKTGVLQFAKGLTELGFEIVSTGGTAKYLREKSVEITEISDVTSFPECLDGRVKTLHPNVLAGVLAVRENENHLKQLEDLSITPVDVVAVNLYPFKETILKKNVMLDEAVENIDIGGPTMIRAAAKNWRDVVVVIDPGDYGKVLELLKTGKVSSDEKYNLACKVFEYTAAYDAIVANYMRRRQDDSPMISFPQSLTLTYDLVQKMRYGENPHQQAAFYREIKLQDNGVASAVQLQGKELSYNNINDANRAIDILKEFSVVVPCAVAVKHANPCGVGLGEILTDAYIEAYEADPVSIFGGIVAVNREIDAQTALKMSEIFLEIIIAPSFSDDALSVFSKKKDLRLLALNDINIPNSYGMIDVKKVAGGLLVQELDTELYLETDLKTVTKRAPTRREITQLMFAWRVVKHANSNAIVLVKGNATVGIGQGQTNRIASLELALRFAGEEHALGSVMASDAFFPFKDCVEAATNAGITAIIQPGGSVRDEESIKACDEAGIAMVFTGMRHFKH